MTKAASTPEAGPEGADREAEILFPDGTVEVADPENGKHLEIRVRAFRAREALEAQAAAHPLLAALAELGRDPAADEAGGTGGEPRFGPGGFERVLGEHADIWIDLVARATGRSAEWLERLDAASFDRLGDAVFLANADFFYRRIRNGVAAAVLSRRSSPSSSAPGTAPSSGS